MQIPEFRRNLQIASYLNYLFEKAGLLAIVVGGHAVEIYTAGSYHTADVDLVLNGRNIAGSLLEEVGFDKSSDGRHWEHPELNFAIEIPDDRLLGSMDRINRVEIGDGFSVNVIGIEDLVMDRLRAYVYWQSRGDGEWALFIMKAQKDRIDFEYLETTAQSEGKDIYHALLELKKEL